MLSRFMVAAYQYARHQLTSFNSSPLETPSEETMATITSLFHQLTSGRDVDEQLVVQTLKGISESEDILQVMDYDKYNLLHKAIIWNKIEIVRAILGRGCSSNNVAVLDSIHCEDVNRPLHLACFLGRKETVSLLLRSGGDPTLRSSLSLIAPAGPEELVPQLFKIFQPLRSAPKELAFHFAVCGDNVEVLQLLFEWEREMLLTSITDGELAAPLFVACKAGARRCLLYMLEENDPATIVNATNEEGFTPLHYAVQRGKWFVEKLLQHGANVGATNRYGQNVLHRLFAVDGKLHPDFYAITQLLLDVGIHREINCADRHGYTPLLLLLHHLNSCWNAESSSGGVDGAISGQYCDKEYNEDVKKCVELMLNYGADANIQCSTGHSALHVILHRNLFPYSSPISPVSVRTEVSGIEVIHDILRLLIEKGSADVNLPLKDGLTTPLLTWIFSLQTCNISPEELFILRTPFLASLDLLLSYGANPNARPAFVLSPLSSMVSWCQIWLSRGHSSSLLAALPIVEEIFSKLFRRNARILSVIRVDERLTFYNTYEAILSMCLSIVESEHLLVVTHLTSHLMLWGLQNELYLPPHYFDDFNMQSIKRHLLYQYLKNGIQVPRLVNDGPRHYETCLRLFCNFTDTSTMRACFEMALETYEEAWKKRNGGVDTATIEAKERMHKLIVDYLTNAQSLKVLARKTIVKSLNGKIPLKADKLQLPNSLRDYIMDMTAT